MRRNRHHFKRRRFKRTSDRKLSQSDLLVLDFLWTWKVATTPMLKLVAFEAKSDWWIYKALRQLKQERYIQVLPRGKFLEQELWALTELGFEVVLMDRDDIAQYRYKPHAPTHDFLGTCLQLGDFWRSKIEVQFFTEQMLTSLSKSNFPRAFTENEEHVPDGITVVYQGNREAIIGYEVDLNLKDEARYKSAFEYWKAAQAHIVIWLVRNTWIANRIKQAVINRYDSEDFLGNKIVFILMEDFKQNVWGAKVLDGKYKGMSVRKLHENLVQSLTKEAPNFSQTSMKEVFFPKFKSPQKSEGYKKLEEVSGY